MRNRVAREQILLDPVVAEIVDTRIEVRYPEDLRLQQDRQPLLHLEGRRGNIEWADPGQLEGRRQTDRYGVPRVIRGRFPIDLGPIRRISERQRIDRRDARFRFSRG